MGKDRHLDLYPTLFEEWKGIFYLQCPKDRAPHTMAFDGSVMGTLREGSVKPRQQSADCEVRMLPPALPGCPLQHMEFKTE